PIRALSRQIFPSRLESIRLLFLERIFPIRRIDLKNLTHLIPRQLRHSLIHPTRQSPRRVGVGLGLHGIVDRHAHDSILTPISPSVGCLKFFNSDRRTAIYCSTRKSSSRVNGSLKNRFQDRRWRCHVETIESILPIRLDYPPQYHVEKAR